MVALSASWILALGAPEPTEYELKAVFLERFARFVEWPPSAPEKPFCVAVVGRDPFSGLLERLYANRPIKGRSVEIRHILKEDAIAVVTNGCHLLFITASAERHLNKILAATASRPVLLVGDNPGLAVRGVHIGFYVDRGLVRFEINPVAVRSSGLNISYLLLEVARVVPPGGSP